MCVPPKRVHSLKVNVMSPADRPIPKAANARGELETDRNIRCPLTENRAGGRPTTAEVGDEHRSHHSSLPFRADPSRDPEDALAGVLSLIVNC